VNTDSCFEHRDIFEATILGVGVVVSVLYDVIRTELLAPDSLQFASKMELNEEQ